MKKSLLLLLILCSFSMSFSQVFNIKDFGASAGSGVLNTPFIQAAIDSAEKAGGGTVLIPEGVYLSSTIFLKDNVTLQIAKGGTLKGATKVAQYPIVIPNIRSFGDTYPQRSLIYAEGKNNIALTGEGTIDGNGLSADFLLNNDEKPFGIRFISCKNVLYQGLTLKNSGFWMMHNLNCDTVTIKNLKIINHSYGNNDGINIDGSRNVLIENCNVDSNNDPVVIKTMSPEAPAENIEVRNCVLATYSRAIKVGTETFAPVRNLYVHDVEVKYSTLGPFGTQFPGNCGILLSIVDGGLMDGVVIERVNIKGVNTALLIRLGDRGSTYSDTIPALPAGSMRNIRLENINMEQATNITSSITGIPGHLAKNITLKNVNFTIPGGGKAVPEGFEVPENIGGKPEHTIFGETLPSYGLFIRHIDSLVLDNVCFTLKKADERPELIFEDTANVTLVPCGTTTGIFNSTLLNADIYPNPASNVLNIRLNESTAKGVFTIHDAGGKTIKSIAMNSIQNAIDISELSSGVYFVTFSNEKGEISAGKFFKH